MRSWTRKLFFLLALSVAATAQTRMTVDQLVSFIKSSLELKQDDRQIANYLKTKKVTLSNKLDARTVETLQGMGAGPSTVAALRLLITESSSLPPPPPPAPKLAVVLPPAPDSIEQQKILAEIRESALNYTKSLPNFICMQVTRRYADISGMENYRLMDTIAEKLSYFEQKEDYKLVSKNNIPGPPTSSTRNWMARPPPRIAPR